MRWALILSLFALAACRQTAPPDVAAAGGEAPPPTVAAGVGEAAAGGAPSIEPLLAMTLDVAQRPGGLLGLGLPVALDTVEYWIVTLLPEPGLEEVVADLHVLHGALRAGDAGAIGGSLRRLAEAAAAAGAEHPDWTSDEEISLADLAVLLSEGADELEGP